MYINTINFLILVKNEHSQEMHAQLVMSRLFTAS